MRCLRFRLKRPRLVPRHQGGVADDVGEHDRREPAFRAFGIHRLRLPAGLAEAGDKTLLLRLSH